MGDAFVLINENDSVEEALGWMVRGESPSLLYKICRKVSMQWMSQYFDYDRKIRQIERRPLESAKEDIHAQLKRRLLTNRAQEAQNFYQEVKHNNPALAAIILDDLIAFLASPEQDLRWATRWVLGMIISFNIQSMLDVEDKARDVLARYKAEANEAAKGIMLAILKSCIGIVLQQYL